MKQGGPLKPHPEKSGAGLCQLTPLARMDSVCSSRPGYAVSWRHMEAHENSESHPDAVLRSAYPGNGCKTTPVRLSRDNVPGDFRPGMHPGRGIQTSEIGASGDPSARSVAFSGKRPRKARAPDRCRPCLATPDFEQNPHYRCV